MRDGRRPGRHHHAGHDNHPRHCLRTGFLGLRALAGVYRVELPDDPEGRTPLLPPRPEPSRRSETST